MSHTRLSTAAPDILGRFSFVVKLQRMVGTTSMTFSSEHINDCHLPPTQTYEGYRNTFFFYNRDTRRLIKVLRTLSPFWTTEGMERYLDVPVKLIMPLIWNKHDNS